MSCFQMTDQPSETLAMDDPEAPITRTPDLTRWRKRYERLPNWLKPVWDYLVVMADAPSGFAKYDLRELAKDLSTDDLEVANATLADAESTLAEPVARIQNAESRATTLLGSVAIAATVAVAGAGLLAGTNPVAATCWRVAFGAVLALFILCLVGSAVRALSATNRIFSFPNSGTQLTLKRAKMSATEAVTHRAAEILRTADVADKVAEVKVGLLRAAATWFRWALGWLTVLVLLGAIYGLTHTGKPTTSNHACRSQVADHRGAGKSPKRCALGHSARALSTQSSTTFTGGTTTVG